MALGRNNVVHIAVTDAGASGRISALLARWQSYLGCANGAPGEAPAKRDYVEEGPSEAAE